MTVSTTIGRFGVGPKFLLELQHLRRFGCGAGVRGVVIIAWCLRYVFFSFNLTWGADPNDFFFNQFLQISSGPFDFGDIRFSIILALIAVWGVSWVIVYFGVQKGVERANKVFMPLLLAMILPSLMFFGYAALSYQDQGFFKQDPWLILRILAIFPIAAAFHTTLIVGVSSLVKQPKFASAIYAGIYLLSSFAAKMLGVVSIEVDDAPPAMQRFAEAASYCSIDGLIKGAGKLVLGTDGSPMFGVRMGDGPDPSLIPAPTHLLVIVGMGGLAGLALGETPTILAWRTLSARAPSRPSLSKC